MLHLHRAERADALADALGEVLRTPLPDPFAREVVAVPARGVERWLVQRLSHVLGAGDRGDGVCSGTVFPSTGRLLAQAVARADDPWDAERLVWPLLDTVDGCLGEPWLALLAEHLGADDHGGYRHGRRWGTAAQLAGLFASYAANRPDMLRDWAAGRDTDGPDTANPHTSAPDTASQDIGGLLPRDLRWQAELWRRLRAALGPSPAERLPALCEHLRTDPDSTDLPARISLFGPTRLSTEQLQLLRALAEHRDVHLWLPHPSPVLWARIAVSAAAGTGRVRRRADPTRDEPRHPLLASLGRDSRELQLVLNGVAAGTAESAWGASTGGSSLQVTDVHHPGAGFAAAPGTLLARLQADVRDDRAPTGGHLLDRRDRSVAVHSCHGPARQVEVLREVLVRAFQDDPTLEPRDVLVMCPDIETYAPLVSAAFGIADGEHPGHRLRVRLADRSLRQTNPLLDVVARLLTLAGGRVTASEVLDLAATAPVRRRFGFDGDELERLRGWVAAVGTRWGLDREHRARLGLNLPQGTWQTGLDRILLGVAASEDGLRWLDLALPLDDVDSGDVDLAGRFAEFVDRLAEALDALVEQPAQDWADALADGLDSLAEVPDTDAWQLAQTRWELARATAGARTPIGLADARAMLAERLRGRPTRANFRTGSLTVATMVPMRSVPHRVVALLGLDDGTFPRVAIVDGDDVLLRDPCVGERDRRSEDRQLLLDALLATGEQLVVLYTGADPLTGERRPAAVPIGELLDVLDATCTEPVRSRLVRRNPLQPFDRRDFEGGDVEGGDVEGVGVETGGVRTGDLESGGGFDGRPFSFDRTSLRGARRAAGERHPAPPFLAAPLPALGGDVDLGDLVSFLQHPVRAFLRQRLGVGVPGEVDEVEDALPIVLDGLATWDVGERILTERLAGADARHVDQAELRRGTLPPGPLGLAVLADIDANVKALLADSPRPGPARTVDVRVDLGGGRSLTGTVTGVHGQLITRTTYSRLGARHRLRGWVQLLAVAAAHPGQPWEAVVTGRPVGTTMTPPPDPLRELRALVDLRDEGLRAPLPMAASTSAAYAGAREQGRNPEQALAAAARSWTSQWGGEREDPHHQLVWGAADLEVLLAEPGTSEPTRFGDLARALWAPLLTAEQ